MFTREAKMERDIDRWFGVASAAPGRCCEFLLSEIFSLCSIRGIRPPKSRFNRKHLRLCIDFAWNLPLRTFCNAFGVNGRSIRDRVRSSEVWRTLISNVKSAGNIAVLTNTPPAGTACDWQSGREATCCHLLRASFYFNVSRLKLVFHLLSFELLFLPNSLQKRSKSITGFMI